MFFYAYVAYLTFKYPDWETTNFERYPPEVFPSLWVFLSTDRVIPNVLLNEGLTRFFSNDITLLVLMCCILTLGRSSYYQETLLYFHIVYFNVILNLHYST
jgi:hypothetical protein